ncbi:HlyD family efflux transporter periplasmic adaptor subunit [Sediminimonas sp.]|uniref:efflux RND transporter periplasmic adaptor subunit n=1 Tax=Sediminimonas sp. TaxID=2823379 RepID=UPI0025CBABCE|nr:HlyD family efflux transporter periplasmic adaptor subunit [Sediminimonas sp.]
MKRARILRLLPPLAVGAGIAAWLIAGSEPPERVTREVRSVTARTQIVAPRQIRPVARGFGTVRPARSWEAVAEVAGAVTYRHPDLETGKLVSEGTRVLEIDPTRYRIALRQTQADLAALRAEKSQIEMEAENTRRILEIERERRALAESDLDRVRALAARGAVPQSRLDDQERATLQLRRGVQELENTLSLIPVQRARLDAQVARAEAGLSRARRDLEKTRIETPFDLRVGQVHVERHQFVPAGAPLVSGDGIDRAEVTAHVPFEAFPRLIGAAAHGSELEAGELNQVLGRIEAELRLVPGNGQSWKGRVIRVENALDPQARSVPVVVAVEAPYGDANPPLRLPLVPNMYVEVTLTGPPGPPQIAVPAGAVHEGDTVYLRDGDGLLALRQITLGWRQGGMAVIEAGLDEGDEVVLDDIVPAIPGLRVIAAENGS